MDHCGQCGAELPEDSEYCGACGTEVSDLLMSVQGKSGSVDLYRTKITLRHKGYMAWNTGTKGNKDIYLSRISSVQLRTPGWFTVGFIRFAFAGGQEYKGGLQSAIHDANAVTFVRKQHAQFSELKDYVEELIGRSSASPPIALAPAASAPIAHLDELERLAQLRDRGIISADDFDAKKRQILGLS